jgi:Ca2+-binding EF-hand superfamily protein
VPAENLEECFDQLDANHDGKIQKEEFLDYYLRSGVAVWYII